MTADMAPGARVVSTRSEAVVELRDLVKHYPVRRGVLRRTVAQVQAVAGVSLQVGRGSTLGIVGESGSGKSTVARLIMRLVDATSGTILIDDADITSATGHDLQLVRKRVQMVFQDPYSSFDPLSSIADSLSEPLRTHTTLTGKARLALCRDLLGRVGLSARYLDRYPSELSGGQLQRAAIARALTVAPEVLVLDEPVSALDVSTQAQVINLLEDLQEESGISLLFIAHDLAVVRHVSDRIVVMYLGRVVEEGPAAAVYERPCHPYTAALLSAIPQPDPVGAATRKRILLQGDIPSPINPPSGCRFRTRCPFAMPECATEDPPPYPTSDGGVTYCHLHSIGPTLSGETVIGLAAGGGRL
jgi:oligopeptide/dipeptide ABC transporter ATP-binding protein